MVIILVLLDIGVSDADQLGALVDNFGMKSHWGSTDARSPAF
jgi:hypothetical protein